MVIAMAHVLEEYTAATEHGWYGESASPLRYADKLISCCRQP